MALRGTIGIRGGNIFMRFRTAAASAALVLCATTAVAACSSSGTADDTRPAGPAASSGPVSVEGVTGTVERGKHQAGEPEMVEPEEEGPADCATSAARISPDCEVPGLSSTEIDEGQSAPGAPPGQ